MHAVDVVLVGLAVVIIVLCAAVLARQRYMMRASGGQPVAIRVRDHRWIYGIARYTGGELRWYRAIGVGTRPTKVMDRGELAITGHRSPTPAELNSLPATAVIVECRFGAGTTTLAFGESGFTGFVSWLESSAPMS